MSNLVLKSSCSPQRVSILAVSSFIEATGVAVLAAIPDLYSKGVTERPYGTAFVLTEVASVFFSRGAGHSPERSTSELCTKREKIGHSREQRTALLTLGCDPKYCVAVRLLLEMWRNYLYICCAIGVANNDT